MIVGKIIIENSFYFTHNLREAFFLIFTVKLVSCFKMFFEKIINIFDWYHQERVINYSKKLNLK